MPSSITCSTKILTLVIALLLFILVGVLCELPMVPCVQIFYCPLRKESYTIPPEGTDVHILQHTHQKDLKLYLTSSTMPRLLMNWKKHKQRIQLCYGVYNETK